MEYTKMVTVMNDKGLRVVELLKYAHTVNLNWAAIVQMLAIEGLVAYNQRENS